MDFTKYVKLNEPTKFMKYSVYYRLGGMNYFSGNVEKRGIVFSASPVERENNWEKYIGFTGCKFLIEPLKRKSSKKLQKYEQILEKNIEEIHKAYQEGRIRDIQELFKT